MPSITDDINNFGCKEQNAEREEHYSKTRLQICEKTKPVYADGCANNTELRCGFAGP